MNTDTLNLFNEGICFLLLIFENGSIGQQKEIYEGNIIETQNYNINKVVKCLIKGLNVIRDK